MEFLNSATITTGDFYYDLFDTKYINPEKLLKNQEDIDKVNEAVKIINEFYNSAITNRKIIIS